jgi:hypothetical protein
MKPARTGGFDICLYCLKRLLALKFTIGNQAPSLRVHKLCWFGCQFASGCDQEIEQNHSEKTTTELLEKVEYAGETFWVAYFSILRDSWRFTGSRVGCDRHAAGSGRIR